MSPEWTAEHVVDAGRAAELIAAQFPALAGTEVRPLAEGWDSTVHVVDGRWAFRFPRRELAVGGLRREIAVLPLLAPRLQLAVPVPELVGTPHGDYPWPFVGSPLIPGVELADSGLDDRARVPVAADVGRFLRSLHATPVRLTAPHLLVDPLGRGDPDVRVPKAREWLDRLVRRGLVARDDRVDAVLDDALALGASASAPVVSHADFHLRHVLVADGRATGVIDWNDVCLADPAVDLSVAYGAFAGPAREQLLAAYGEVDPATEVRARMLALFLCAALAEYAAAEGHRGLLEEALRGLGRAVV